jgi:hypothetical protein
MAAEVAIPPSPEEERDPSPATVLTRYEIIAKGTKDGTADGAADGTSEGSADGGTIDGLVV